MGKLSYTIRYLTIIRKVRDQPGITLEKLRGEVANDLEKHGINDWDISQSTLKRDLRDLREKFSLPLEYSKVQKGYHFPSSEEFPPDNIELFLETFDVLNTLDADSGLQNILLSGRHYNRGTEHLHFLVRAIKRCKPVTFSYLKFGETEPTERYVYPYFLKEATDRWYLLALQKGEKNLKAFGLDRIYRLSMASGTFKRAYTFDVAAEYKDVFGIFNLQGCPVEDIQLAFDYRDGEYVKSLPIHHSQKVVEENRGENRMVISLRLKITDDFRLALLSRGTSLKVLAPDHLREEIHEICSKMAGRNESPD